MEDIIRICNSIVIFSKSTHNLKKKKEKKKREEEEEEEEEGMRNV